jgi:hypothetical protein
VFAREELPEPEDILSMNLPYTTSVEKAANASGPRSSTRQGQGTRPDGMDKSSRGKYIQAIGQK